MKDVCNFVRHCKSCSYSGHPQIRDNYSSDTVDQLGQRVYIDYTGPLFDGSHLLVIVDGSLDLFK